MARIRITQQGMTIDKAVWEATGASDYRYVEETLELNPHLASLPVILPVGTEFEVPEISSKPVRRQTVRLWD